MLKSFHLRYCFTADMHFVAYRSNPDRAYSNPDWAYSNPDRVLNPVRVISPVKSIILLIMIVLVSCSKKEIVNVPPSISLVSQTGTISSDTILGVNSTMVFAISAKGGSTNLTNLIVLVSNSDTCQRFLDTSMNISSFLVTKKFIKGLDNSEVWTFIVRDKNRLSDSVSINILRDTSVGFSPIKHITSLIMSAQNNSEPGSFYSFASDQVYSLDEASQHQDLIDLVYYFGEDELTMASPGANIETGIFEGDLLDWSLRRTTRFIELSIPAEFFENCENDSLLIASYSEALGKRKAKLLSPGKLFSFKTADLKCGIFRVISTEGTLAGTVNVEIKVQE